MYVSCRKEAGGTGVVFLLDGTLGDTSLQRLCVSSSTLAYLFLLFLFEISDTIRSGGKDGCILFDVFVLFQPI